MVIGSFAGTAIPLCLDSITATGAMKINLDNAIKV